ncbi:MAG: hypothetical protein B6D36_17760 [Planctomycetes bacterium UTPLA1]|nr:MAG: hypothetical protein B6D36_17760 [Planctomycetes bacterium UTPLA1]
MKPPCPISKWVPAIAILALAAGCGPTIKTITPTGKQPLESVLIEGDGARGALKGLDHAAINVDGGPVGTPLFSYPRPEVFIPVRRGDGRTTTGTVEVSAQNAAGVGNVVAYSAANVPVNAPTVSIDVITPPVRLQFANEITMTIVGGGIFPGARNADLERPHAGPPEVQAVPADGGANVSAVKAICLTANSIQVFFADTLPHGTYRIYLKNDERYGGASGTSDVMFEWK